MSRAYYAVRSAFRDLAEAMQDEGIEVISQDDRRLVLSANGNDITVDRRMRTVRSGDKLLTRFDAIKYIDISGYSGDNDRPYWVVSLRLGLFKRVRIGWTCDQVDASIAAARLSTMTGAKVVA